MDAMLIRKVVRNAPFRPFTLKLNDGREYYVRHPELIAVDLTFVFVIDDQTERGIYLEPALIAHFKLTRSIPQTANNVQGSFMKDITYAAPKTIDAEYRRHLVGVLVKRALAIAIDRAKS